MSDLISDHLFQTIVPSGILIASLAGSGHCVGMCGGLVISFTKNSKGVALYHAGRLLTYSALGALAGAFGSAAFKTGLAHQAPWLASALFGLVLFLVGIRRLSSKPFHLEPPKFISKLLTRVISFASKKSESNSGIFLLGALSAFLPCGWLYTFVLAAAATQSAILGAVSLGLFWLGSVPALSIAPLAFRKLTVQMRAMMPRISGVLMIGLGISALFLHAAPLFNMRVENGAKTQFPASCPLHHKSR